MRAIVDFNNDGPKTLSKVLGFRVASAMEPGGAIDSNLTVQILAKTTSPNKVFGPDRAFGSYSSDAHIILSSTGAVSERLVFKHIDHINTCLLYTSPSPRD